MAKQVKRTSRKPEKLNGYVRRMFVLGPDNLGQPQVEIHWGQLPSARDDDRILRYLTIVISASDALSMPCKKITGLINMAAGGVIADRYSRWLPCYLYISWLG